MIQGVASSALQKLQNTLYDFFLLAVAFLYLSGGVPLIHGQIEALIHRKPWIHRAAMVLLFVSIFGLIGVRKILRRTHDIPKSTLEILFDLCRLSASTWIWILFVLTSISWTACSWTRHEVFHTSFDMAIFVQAVWNTLHGDFLYSSIKGGICLLGDHFSPLLAALALPYAVWPDPKCLLLVQAVALAGSVFPLYKIAKEKKLDDFPAICIVIAFILYLPSRNAVRFDFHPELLATPFFLWGFYHQMRSKLWPASVFFLIALLAKENAALVLFALGFYSFFMFRQRKFGLFWMIFPVSYFFAVIRWVIPSFSGEEYFYLRGNFNAWEEEGISSFLRHLVSPASAVYLFKIFAPVGFLSFLDPGTLLLCGPMLLQNLTARNEMVRSIFFQYTAFLTPFVSISTIFGAAHAVHFFKKDGHDKVALYLLITTFLMSGVSDGYILYRHLAKFKPRMSIIKSALHEIPAHASVRTHEFLASHAAHRKQLHIYENQHPKEGASQAALTADYVVLDQVLLGAEAETHFRRLYEKGYRVVAQKEGLFIFRRGQTAL